MAGDPHGAARTPSRPAKTAYYTRTMTPERLLPAFLLAASAATLGTALLFQYVGGYPPCSLCHYQRWPYIAVIGLSAAALLFATRRPLSTAFGLLAGAVLLAGCGVALYHVGVEQGVFEGPNSCTSNLGAATTLDELRERLLAAPMVRCDEVAWSVLGVSMAGWNAALAFVLGGVAFGVSLRRRRRRRLYVRR